MQPIDIGFDYAVKNNFFDNDEFVVIKEEVESLKRKAVDIPKDGLIAASITKKVEKYFEFNIKQISLLQHTFNCNKPTFLPHVDLNPSTTAQIIIYIKGKDKQNSGTGFFRDEDVLKKDSSPVDVIGFQENRALFFNSKMPHAPAYLGKWGLWRWAMIGFLK